MKLDLGDINEVVEQL